MNTMKKSMPHAMSTFCLRSTMATPPSCPTRLRMTKRVARNQPQPQLCGFAVSQIVSSQKIGDFQCYTVHPILLGLMEIWQKELSN